MKERIIKVIESWGFKRHGSFYRKSGDNAHVFIEINESFNVCDVLVEVSLRCKNKYPDCCGSSRFCVRGIHEDTSDEEVFEAIEPRLKREIVDIITRIGWNIADSLICKEK